MSFQAEAPPLMSFSASWIIYVKLIRLLTPFFSLHDFYWHMCSVFGNDRNFAETCAWPSPPSRATKRTSRITSIWCKQQFWLLLACRTQHEWRSLSGKVWKKIIHTHARTHSHAHAHIYWRSNHARPLFSPLDIHVVLTHTHNMNVKLGTFVVVILLMFALSANADTQLWFFWTRFLRSAHTHTHTTWKNIKQEKLLLFVIFAYLLLLFLTADTQLCWFCWTRSTNCSIATWMRRHARFSPLACAVRWYKRCLPRGYSRAASRLSSGMLHA